MATRASGWYDDPNDPNLMRYWDGVEWSARTMPKIAPGLEHVGEAKPASQRVQSENLHQPRSSQEYPAHWGPQEFHTTPRPGGDESRLRIAGVFARIFATLIDRILVGVVVTLVSWPFMRGWMNGLEDYVQQVQDAMSAHTDWPPMPDSVATPPYGYAIALALTLIAYDVVMTIGSRRSIGKRMFGLRVRPANGEDVTPVMALRRALVKWSPEIVGMIPVIASGSTLLYLVVIAWMIFAPLHRGPQDAAGDTTVERIR